LGFATSSDLTLKIAFWSGIAATIIAVALIIQIFLLKIALSSKARRHRKIITLWQPIIIKGLYNLPAQLPPLATKDVASFMVLWNRIHSTVRGETKNNLNALARHVELHAHAFHFLKSLSTPKRLLAIVTLGNLREPSVWDELAAIAAADDSLIALAASHSLVLIDADKAVQLLLPLLCERTDWFPVRSLSLLREAGPDAVSAPIEKAAQNASWRSLPRLIRFLETAHQETASRVIHRVLSGTRNEAIILQALRQVIDAKDINKIRRYLSHPSWPVRVQAASALGRLGTKGDEKLLIGLLDDPQWWVRYRAARALAQLPFVNPDDLSRIRDEQRDNFAKDILGQVLAEEGRS